MDGLWMDTVIRYNQVGRWVGCGWTGTADRQSCGWSRQGRALNEWMGLCMGGAIRGSQSDRWLDGCG